MKRTKIIATVGPASQEMVDTLRRSGMDAVRINTSHGDMEQYEKIIDDVSSIGIPIILDTQGPEVRIECAELVPVKDGQKLYFGDDEPYSFSRDITKFLNKGMQMLIDDGLFKLQIQKIEGRKLTVKVIGDGAMRPRIRVNLPGVDFGHEILSPDDGKVIELANKKDVAYVALSYTQSAGDVKKVKKMLGDTAIIAKIEDSIGVKNIDSIIEVVDGVMIARGDLGVEIASERLPLIQKEIIKKCNQTGTLVITATQMLQSMITNPRPTRAETSDVANAILDGTDCVMLSGETAIGKYPLESVKEMVRIAHQVEDHVLNKVVINECTDVSDAISKSIHEMTHLLPITKVVTMTHSGFTARMVSRFRLKQEVIALTAREMVRKQLSLYYGITPVVVEKLPSKNRVLCCARYLHKKKYLLTKDMVLFAGSPYSARSTNMIEVHDLKSLIGRKTKCA